MVKPTATTKTLQQQPPQETPISQAVEVSKSFFAKTGLRAGAGGGGAKFVQALDRVSLSVNPGETVGLVGESGCGKSTLGRTLIKLETPTAGDVFFEGVNITKLSGTKLRKIRQSMQMIFQDPASSLNPGYSVYSTLKEAIQVHRGRLSSRKLNAHIAALLNMVGLPVSCLSRLPHEFSGGERQRIAIARTLAVEPRFIVADEPISSLDLSSQEQIVTLLKKMRQELHVAFLLINHDMETVKRLCDRVAVMYLGQIVELASTNALFKSPNHPYSKALISAVLSTNPEKKSRLNILQGDPPSPLDPPTGCYFHPRCPFMEVQCKLLAPALRKTTNGHFTKCHFDFDGNDKLNNFATALPANLKN